MKCGNLGTIRCDHRNSYGDCLLLFNCIEEGEYINGVQLSDGKAYVWTNNPSAVIKIGSLSITDLFIEFDEMGFIPTTLCPKPEEYAIEFS